MTPRIERGIHRAQHHANFDADIVSVTAAVASGRYEQEKPATPAISDSPAVRSADQERETLPVTSDEKGALSIAWRRKR
jgi:hypothetical protein